MTRLTMDPGLDQYPTWTPDGRRLIFASTRGGSPNLFWQRADHTGAAERLTTSGNNQYPMSVSPDGSHVVFRENLSGGESILKILELGPAGATAGNQPRVVVGTNHIDDNGELSPDGRWLAYQSNASGRPEIYVRPFPDAGGGVWQISASGGTKPTWARNGRELFYLDARNTLTAVSVQTTPTFEAATSRTLFAQEYFAAAAGRTYDVSADGQRFLMIKSAPGPQSTTSHGDIVVVLHWSGELNATRR